jgi:hypothetical protein
LHSLHSGKTLKVVKDLGGVGCLFRVGSVVAFGGKKQIIFYDLITQKQMEICPVKVECDVKCMQIGIKKSPRDNHPQPILFVGGCNSSKLTEITLPKKIADKSNPNHYNST